MENFYKLATYAQLSAVNSGNYESATILLTCCTARELKYTWKTYM